jgi:hypothetical protein
MGARVRVVLAGLTLMLGACAKNHGATQSEPLTEFLCKGRGEVAEITGRIEATTREVAEEKFREQHKDVLNPTCTPNPRR